MKQFCAEHGRNDQPDAEIADALRGEAGPAGAMLRGEDAGQETGSDEHAVGVNLQRAEANKNRIHAGNDAVPPVDCQMNCRC